MKRSYNDQPQIDEFGLLAEIVHSENVDLLEIINKKQLFPIAQKDESTGDNLLHYAIFENKTEFIHRVLHLYENEVNTKNARGNTPFHYACLRGNIEIVLCLFYMKKANQAQSQARVQPVNLTIMNKAGYLPI